MFSSSAAAAVSQCVYIAVRRGSLVWVTNRIISSNKLALFFGDIFSPFDVVWWWGRTADEKTNLALVPIYS